MQGFTRVTEGVEFAVGSPEKDHPVPGQKKIPLVEKEGNRCDTEGGYLYLRGVRLSDRAERGLVKARVDGVDSDPLDIVVTRPVLGESATKENPRISNAVAAQIEEAIIDAASKYGVPPQFLKSAGVLRNAVRLHGLSLRTYYH